MDEEEFSEDEEYSEGAEYSPKSEFSKPKLVEEAVRKCIEARSKEMKEGYNNYKIDNSGNITAKIWIPDARKIFISHVIALRNLLSPEIKNNNIFKVKEEKLNDETKKLFEEHSYTVKKEVRKDDGILWVNVEPEKKIVPEKDALTLNYNEITKRAKLEVGSWNNHIKEYWDGMVLINDQLFAALNDLCDSLNYFKQKVSY